MQGYRPTAVTEYAVRLLRAEREAKPLPPSPAALDPIPDPEEIKDVTDCSGTFTAPDGSKLVFTTHGKRLRLQDGEQLIPLQATGDDSFISTVGGRYASYGLIFKRTAVKADAGSKTPDKPEESCR